MLTCFPLVSRSSQKRAGHLEAIAERRVVDAAEEDIPHRDAGPKF